MKLFAAKAPLESVAIDILGPLPKSNRGHLFVHSNVETTRMHSRGGHLTVLRSVSARAQSVVSEGGYSLQ